MTRIITDISVSPDGFVTGPGPGPDNGLFTGGTPRTPVRRSVLATSTATHPTYGIVR